MFFNISSKGQWSCFHYWTIILRCNSNDTDCTWLDDLSLVNSYPCSMLPISSISSILDFSWWDARWCWYFMAGTLSFAGSGDGAFINITSGCCIISIHHSFLWLISLGMNVSGMRILLCAWSSNLVADLCRFPNLFSAKSFLFVLSCSWEVVTSW